MTEEEYAALTEAEKAALVAELKAKAAQRSDAEKREIAKRRAKSLHQLRVNNGPSARPTLGEGDRPPNKFRTRFKRK